VGQGDAGQASAGRDTAAGGPMDEHEEDSARTNDRSLDQPEPHEMAKKIFQQKFSICFEFLVLRFLVILHRV
jgi:hypothetical protein